MTTYNPDSFVLLKVVTKKETYFKVLGGWSGSYMYGGSWRMNSGIKSFTEDENTIYFKGFTGSIYEVPKGREGLSLSMPSGLDAPDNVEFVTFEDFKKEFIAQ